MFLRVIPTLVAPTTNFRRALELSAVTALSAAAFPLLGSSVAAPVGPKPQVKVDLPRVSSPPLLLREVDREEALRINASIPFSVEPIPPARPFKIREGDAVHARALHCLTQAIYYEAASEDSDGQRAVAQVVLNRVRHPAFTPSVCGTVYHGSLRSTGCQFSFTCDGSMRRKPSASGWARAAGIAQDALAGAVFEPVGNATHYHADYVVPYWASSLRKIAVLGTHIFYRWPGWWGQPAAFAKRHSGKEIDPRLLRNAALRRHGVRPEPPSWTADDLALGVDPRVELISIVQLLAARSPPGETDTAYEKAVRKHFADHADHVAVEIYRQLAARNGKFDAESSLRALMHYSHFPKLEAVDSIDPDLIRAAGGMQKLDGFLSALRDFVRHTDFEIFLEKSKPYYAELEARVRKPTHVLVTGVEQDTGAPAHKVRFILAPLRARSAMAWCQALPKKAPEAGLIVGLHYPPEQPFDKKGKLRDSLASLAESECRPSRAAVATGPLHLDRRG